MNVAAGTLFGPPGAVLVLSSGHTGPTRPALSHAHWTEGNRGPDDVANLPLACKFFNLIGAELGNVARGAQREHTVCHTAASSARTKCH